MKTACAEKSGHAVFFMHISKCNYLPALQTVIPAKAGMTVLRVVVKAVAPPFNVYCMTR